MQLRPRAQEIAKALDITSISVTFSIGPVPGQKMLRPCLPDCFAANGRRSPPTPLLGRRWCRSLASAYCKAISARIYDRHGATWDVAIASAMGSSKSDAIGKAELGNDRALSKDRAVRQGNVGD